MWASAKRAHLHPRFAESPGRRRPTTAEASHKETASKAQWRQAIVEVRDDLAPEPGSYFQGETQLRAAAERFGDFIIFQCPLRHTASFRCGAEVRKRLSGADYANQQPRCLDHRLLHRWRWARRDDARLSTR